MRRIGIVLAVVGGILVLGIAAVWVLANPNRHRARIQAELEKQLGRKVELGEMSLGLLPLRFQVQQPVIAEDPRLAQKSPFVKAEKLDVRVRLFPLIRGSVQVDSVDLVRPSVELVKTKSGDWNFSSLGPASAAAPAETGGTGGPVTEFRLDRLTITDGQIGITDLQKGSPRTAYDHIDLTLRDFAPGMPFSFDLAAHVQGDGTQQLRLKGQGGPVAANPADTPFQGTLNLDQVAIEGLMKFLDSKAITQANGVLSGQSDVVSQGGKVTTNGKLSIAQAQINGLDIGYPIQLDYKMAVQIAEGLVTIDDATLILGQTPLSVAGQLNTAAVPLNMDLKIKSGEVSIAEIARLASAFGVAFSPGATVTGKLTADVHATGSAAKPAVTGTVAGRNLEISGQGVPQPVQVKTVDLTLTPTAIQSNEFTATSGKTTVAARFALLQYTSSSPSADVALRAPGATLPEIQSIAKAYGIKALDQLSGNGTLNFDLRAKGPIQSLTTASAMKALNGTINLDFSPLKVLGFDTPYELGKLGGFASGLTEQNATDIVRVLGKINVKNGIAQTDNLNIQLAVGNLAATGTADLATESLNLKVASVFTKAFSDKVGSTRAGSFMNVAFSNAAGEIVLPAIVTGTFRQPRFAPDLKAVAQLQKQKFIPSLDNPAAAINNVLGVLKGKQDSNTTQEQPSGEKPSVIKGILGVLGGKKTEQGK